MTSEMAMVAECRKWLLTMIVIERGGEMPVYRIKYTKSSSNVVELEASSVSDAWKKIISKQDDKAVWREEGQVSYQPEITEEITRHIASNPKG